MSGAMPEILLVDDQLGVRRGVELILRESGFRVVGTAATTEEAAGVLRRRRYDVALVEAMLEGASTAPLLTALLAERPAAPIVVYAGREESALAAAAALRPPGLVLKSSEPARLLHALRDVAAGGGYIDPGVAERLPEPVARPVRAGIAMLSPRERQILNLLAEGWSGAEIAAQLYLSAETVRTHVRNAVQKLGARTRTQAVALVLTHASATVQTG